MSPYGMRGGDTPESDQFMEKCVNGVMNKGVKDKGRAIAICKVTYEKYKGNAKAALEEIDKIVGAITDK